jgi:hypothetical protein
VNPSPSRETALRALEAVAANLHPKQVMLLERMAIAMSTELESFRNPDSDMANDDFYFAFSNQLLLHHATQSQPLNKKMFEHVLRYAAEEAGRSAFINPNPTDPSWDVQVDDQRYSLKTQADANTSLSALAIQKFMEARWLRDCQTKAQVANEASRRMREHMLRYDRVLMLRARAVVAMPFRYLLYEIPKSVLGLATRIHDGMVEDQNSAKSWGIDLLDERGRAFRMLLDGSVEKVRVYGLQTDRCVLHAEWRVPTPSTTTQPKLI